MIKVFFVEKQQMKYGKEAWEGVVGSKGVDDVAL